MDAFRHSRPLRFMRYLIQQFFANQGILNASALTYTTLFAVVPLMTVSYAMLAAVPSFQGLGDQVQGWVFENFVPATGAVIQEYLQSFTSQARKLTGVGVALLAVTSIMMMKNIEAAFNRIWRVSKPRKGMSSFLLYWAVLSLGPVLMGLGIAVSSYIASLPFISSATDLVGRGRMLSLLPILLSAAAFTLLYAAVPNCRVPLRNALIGGVVVAVLFETAKRGFALFVTQSPSYELIYGAFAAVPLFLLWIYISWVIILLGAELTRALTVFQPVRREHERSHLATVVAVLHRLWDAQQNGQALSDGALLQEVAGLDQGRWDHYQQLLTDAGIIQRNEQGDFLLSRDLSRFSLLELAGVLPWPLPDASPQEALCSWQRRLDLRLQAMTQQREKQLDVPLQVLFSDDTGLNAVSDHDKQTPARREGG
ncbi:MAG: YihY family inner membrane protein [Oceanospirillaceae bacterium]|nr:YihY family inner membrane protein [Oceanospirillaceae bacterium]